MTPLPPLRRAQHSAAHCHPQTLRDPENRPIFREISRIPRPDPAAPRIGETMKILLIDDCEITLESIHVFLEQEIPGVEVTQYPSL